MPVFEWGIILFLGARWGRVSELHVYAQCRQNTGCKLAIESNLKALFRSKTC